MNPDCREIRKVTSNVWQPTIIAEKAPQTGARNMAVDGSLLDRVCNDEESGFVRIYEWNEPTVTLGHFQKPDEIRGSMLEGLPWVKRLTGGGAILHDRELTYSIALPSNHPFRHTPVVAYEMVHAAIVELLQHCGAESALRSDADSTKPPTEPKTGDEKFLCFLRSDPRDIVSKGHKIVGSAQRRRKGCILQHGSILLTASVYTPEIPGILDLWPKFEIDLFRSLLSQSVATAVSAPCDR